MTPARTVSVLVVDDSAVARMHLVHLLEEVMQHLEPGHAPPAKH